MTQLRSSTERTGIENMNTVYLGLGSNRGDRLGYLRKALSEISSLRSTSVIRISGIYETEPWGIKEQNDFLNCAIEISTELEVFELITKLKVIERIAGRTNSSKWHEREIDIDLLFYSDFVIDSENLRVPHSEIEYRKFVLAPLNEIAPHFIHPVLGKSVNQLLLSCKDSLEVSLLGNVKLIEETTGNLKG